MMLIVGTKRLRISDCGLRIGKFQIRNSHFAIVGFTLIELLVVFSIVAIIMGFGLAFWSHSGRQVGFQALRGEINSIIQYARSAARTERYPTTVVIDPSRKEAYYLGRRTTGLWHFEDSSGNKTTGAFNQPGLLDGPARITPHGKYGNGLLMEKGSMVDLGDIGPRLIPGAAGITIELWFYPFTPKAPTNQRSRSGVPTVASGTILEKIGEYSVMLRNDNSLTARMGSLTASTQPDVISFERWSHLSLTLERSSQQDSLTLSVNHKTMATASGNCILKISKSNLTVGARGASADMIVDELKVGLVVETERVKIHPDDTIISTAVPSTPTSGVTSSRAATAFYVRFDDEGRLVGSPPSIKFTSQSANDNFTITVKP